MLFFSPEYFVRELGRGPTYRREKYTRLDTRGYSRSSSEFICARCPHLYPSSSLRALPYLDWIKKMHMHRQSWPHSRAQNNKNVKMVTRSWAFSNLWTSTEATAWTNITKNHSGTKTHLYKSLNHSAIFARSCKNNGVHSASGNTRPCSCYPYTSKLESYNRMRDWPTLDFYTFPPTNFTFLAFLPT